MPSPCTTHLANTLHRALFLALLGTGACQAQEGLTSASGPSGAPGIHEKHGVPVVDIVAPNANGLSHNRFLDYNVASAGVVLNNALQDGQSQLAGTLTANPQLQGQAASTILNEVVSQNPSLIEGPQEIFGQPANYILANPNGITLDGGSFINTTQAGFVVGTPELQDKQLRFINTMNATGTLQVLDGGQSNAEGALALIAPEVVSTGPLAAAGSLEIVVGGNLIDANAGRIIEHQPGTPGSIDANLLGAMRAGHIRLVSTAEGSGVRMGPTQAMAENGIDIHAAGDLTLDAVDARARWIAARAGGKLILDGTSHERIEHEYYSRSHQAGSVTYLAYELQRTTHWRQQQGTHLQASDNLLLQSGEDMRMVGARLSAGNQLTLDSGANLGISAGIDSQSVEEQLRYRKLRRDDPSKFNPNYDTVARNRQRRITAHVASELDGASVNLKSRGDLQIKGSRVHASAGDIDLSARQITLGITRNERQSLFNRTRSSDNAHASHHKAKLTTRYHSEVQRSILQASGNLGLRGERLVTEATRFGAGERLSLNVARIENRAALNTHELEVQHSEWSEKRDSRLETRGLTRSAETLVQGAHAPPRAQAHMAPPHTGERTVLAHHRPAVSPLHIDVQTKVSSQALFEVTLDGIDDQHLQSDNLHRPLHGTEPYSIIDGAKPASDCTSNANRAGRLNRSEWQSPMIIANRCVGLFNKYLQF